jgi:hypothetical protein
MKTIIRVILSLLAIFILSGCHDIHHVRDIRSVGDGNIEVEKCNYHINGFWGTGGYKDCKIEVVHVNSPDPK